jgi:hypothetical protein
VLDQGPELLPTSDTTLDSMIVESAKSVSSVAAILLRDLIDYAGLFPPASLSMKQALVNYDAYSRSEWSWILGRFVVPVSRLDEFEGARVGLPAPNSKLLIAGLRLSVLLGSDFVADVERINEFSDRVTTEGSTPTAVIESVEVKVATANEIANIAALIPEELDVYFELPLSDCAEYIAAVATCGRRAKVRTGGETADKFPPSESVVEFIRLCAVANVPFKATAGLHHPIRSARRFTYQPDSASGVMHGFLNVFLASAFLRSGMQSDLAVELLEEKSAEGFQFDLDGVRWRDHRLNLDQLAAVRANFAMSFGSCSFTEPVDDLRSLHVL